MSGNPLDPLSHIPEAPPINKWYGFLIKPAVMVIAFMMFSYATLWMGEHYVSNEKFGQYVDRQISNDNRQDEEAKKRFDITQSKLEVIINNQISFTEQLRAYNTIMVGMQKQIDNIDNRVIYLERSSHTPLQFQTNSH